MCTAPLPHALKNVDQVRCSYRVHDISSFAPTAEQAVPQHEPQVLTRLVRRQVAKLCEAVHWQFALQQDVYELKSHRVREQLKAFRCGSQPLTVQ